MKKCEACGAAIPNRNKLCEAHALERFNRRHALRSRRFRAKHRDAMKRARTEEAHP